MGKRLVMGLVAVVAVIALGGIGFAAFSATATINGQATAGSFGLVWGSSPTNSPTQMDSSVCSAGTASGATWSSLSGSYFAPGDGCTFADSLTVTGNLPGTISESLTVSDTAMGCGLQYWTYTDTFVGAQTFSSGQANGPVSVPSGTVAVTSGEVFSFGGTFTLTSGAPNGCQGDVLSISVTITGTAT